MCENKRTKKKKELIFLHVQSNKRILTLMKLTNTIIEDANIILNPEKQLTIQLRNRNLTNVDELDLTEDKYSVIDLSNNQLIEVISLSKLYKLEVLLLNNNHELSSIDPQSFPKLSSLSLASTNFKLASIKNFSEFKNLKSLVLIDSPLASLENYRLIIIHLIPSLLVLDFNKISNTEREKSKQLYGTLDSGSSAAKELFSKRTGLTSAEKKALAQRLTSTNDINEIERIETLLKSNTV